MESTEEDKRRLAAQSMSYNLANPVFLKMFPDAAERARQGTLEELFTDGHGGVSLTSEGAEDAAGAVADPPAAQAAPADPAVRRPNAPEPDPRNLLEQFSKVQVDDSDAPARVPISAGRQAAAGHTGHPSPVPLAPLEKPGGAGFAVGAEVEIHGLVKAAQYNAMR